MDAERFDDLVRRFLTASSRRGVLAGLTSGLLAFLPLLPSGEEIEGKKKRKKKKRKKKKRPSCTPNCADKACGADGCGGSCGNCDEGEVCQAGVCCDPDCTGKTCGDDGCGGSCGTCGVVQICEDGECLCPNQLIVCGDVCLEGHQCCTDDECPGVTACVNYGCRCPDEGDILCSAESCCEPGVEVCPFDRSDPFTGTCQPGGCSASDFCNSQTYFRCAPNCACATSVDGATVCTAGEADECVPCEHDDECTTALGQPAMCIANGPYCGDFCLGVTAFCVATSCPEEASRQARFGHTRSLVSRLVDLR